jgi:hypothetical protein
MRGSAADMRVVVVGATGNHGSSLVRRLARDPEVEGVVGIARRRPASPCRASRGRTADITKDDLAPLLRGADAVVHLGWLIQPGRDESTTHATNVEGSRAVVRGRRARRGPGDRLRVVGRRLLPRPEGPPRRRVLADQRDRDLVLLAPQGRRRAHPGLRSRPPTRACASCGCAPGRSSSARRPRRSAACSPARFLPNPLVRRALIPVVPALGRLRFQAVHTRTSARPTGWRCCAGGPRRVQHRRRASARPVVAGKALGPSPLPLPAPVVRHRRPGQLQAAPAAHRAGGSTWASASR